MGFDQDLIYRIRCYLQPFHNLYHLSHLCCGLSLLESQGLAEIVFTQPGRNASYATDPYSLWLEATDLRTGGDRKLMFDLYDRSDLFVMDSLEQCDVYFKRSYHPLDIEALSPKLKAKIIPFGINYGCQTPATTFHLLSTLMPSWTRQLFKSPLATLKALRAASFQLFLTNPHVSAFERSPNRPLRRAVHFETRIFEQGDLGPNSDEEINRPRVELVRALKKELGALFEGGIVRTRYALRYCPAEVSPYPSGRRSYVSRSREILLGVYTRGLYHSTAFKLGEYLASSKCMVSEPLRNQLPIPLRAGRNYLEFKSPQQCVESCVRLLQDEDLANQMRRDNWEYYQREVRPDRHLANCLERAFTV